MSESASESRTETALPARGLSGLQAAEQWQETSAWNFSLPAGMRALIQSLVAPRRPAVNREGGRPRLYIIIIDTTRNSQTSTSTLTPPVRWNLE